MQLGGTSKKNNIIKILLPLHGYITDSLWLVSATGVTVAAIYLTRRYCAGGVCRAKTRFSNGEVVIVTGGNTGIGLETATELVRRGAHVVLACRDESKARLAVEAIKNVTGVSDKVTFEKLDLASLDSIRAFADKFKKEFRRLDILINNAGLAVSGPRKETVDGFEMQFGVNHLGHFLLTHLLLDVLKSSSPSRVIVLSSKAHFRGKIKWTDLNLSKTYNEKSLFEYSNSKLANVLFTRELAKRLSGSGVSAVCVHPGVVYTEFLRDFPIIIQALAWGLQFVFLKSPWEGAQTTLHCALSNDIPQLSGSYFSDCAVMEPSTEALKDSDAKKLWEKSMEMLHLQ